MKNVVLISIDDLRFDAVGRYFDRSRFAKYDLQCVADTPTLDALASGSVSFGQCIAPSSFTPPSHASMLTGVYPRRHSVHTFYHRLPEHVRTLAEILKEHGFRTFAKVENSSLRLLELTRGMDLVDDHVDDGPELVDHLVSSGAAAGGPCLVFIHLFDCHSPYGLIKGKGSADHVQHYLDHVRDICVRRGIDYERIEARSRQEARVVCRDYDAQGRYVQTLNRMRGLDFALKDELRRLGVFYDEMISSYLWGVSLFDRLKLRPLLARLESSGLLDDAVLIVTSDHGEARHIDLEGDIYFSNGFDLHEGHIRVPLMIRAPDMADSGEVSQPVSLVDIVPTVLELLGIAFDAGRFDGVSLAPLLCGQAGPDPDRAVYGECWAYRGGFNQFGQAGWQKKGFLRKRMVRVDGFKLVRLGSDVTVETLEMMPARQAIERLYNDVLGRFPSIAEVIAWRALLESGRVTIQEMFELFTAKVAATLGKHALIDTERDFEDQDNLFDDPKYGQVRDRLLGLLGRYEMLGEDGGLEADLTPVTREQLNEHLRALGYL